MIYKGSQGIELELVFTEDLTDVDSIVVYMDDPNGGSHTYTATITTATKTASYTFGDDFSIEGLYKLQPLLTYSSGAPVWADPISLYISPVEVTV